MGEISTQESILITGASSGIGRACALHFDSLGFNVFAGVIRKEDALELKKISSKNFKPIVLDVTSPSMISSGRTQVSEYLGGSGLTGLVNNAGIPLGGSVEFLSFGFSIRNRSKSNRSYCNYAGFPASNSAEKR